MFVKITNGQVDQFPYTIGNLRSDNPHTSFPKSIPEATLNAWGVYRVVDQSISSYDQKTHKVVIGEVSLVGDVWTRGRTIESKTQAEIDGDILQASGMVREKRNRMLSESDWTQVSDAPVDQSAWAAYRQSLRDITDHAGFPYLDDSDWPVAP